MLQLAARCGATARELMVSDPIVAWLLGNPERTAHPSRVAYRLLKQQSPIAVLKWAGFEPTHDAARIIRKLPANELNATSVQYLRDVLGGEPQAREWAHLLPRLTEDLLAAMADARIRRVCTFDLLIDFVDRDQAAAGVLRRIARLIGAGCGPTPVFRSSSELRAWFDATLASRRAAAEQARSRERVALDRRLRSPIPGSGTIVPLTTVDVIEQHLSRMRLSVRSMLSDVLAGKCALYQVLEPEEAIAIVTLMGRRWLVADVRGARNRAAMTVTRRKVEEWLREGQGAQRDTLI